MSEELNQKGLTEHGLILGDYQFYNIGSTTLNQLKKYKIIPNKDYKDYSSRRPDALLVNRINKSKPLVVATIEYKDDGKFSNEKDIIKTIQQCNDVAQEIKSKIGIVTDGDKFVWFNPHQKNAETEYTDETSGKLRSYTIIIKDNGEPLTDAFEINQKIDELRIDNLTDKTRETYFLINNLYNLLDKNNSIISSPKSINPLPLAKTVWQDIWIATGKTPEKCLYNVVEVFIFKFLSDLEILKEPENFEYLLSLYNKGKSDEYVLDYYAKICRKKIYELFPIDAIDKTTIINGTIFVDEKGEANLSQSILFKNSLKKFKEFEDKFGKLKNIDKDFKTKLYETFLKQTQGLKGLGQYFTPRKVVRAIVNISGIKNLTKGQRFCDPFCGVGGFILEPINLYSNLKRDFIPVNGKINSNIIYEGYDKGAEKDEERTIILAKANMLIYLSDIIVKNGHLTQEFAKLFNNVFHLLKSNLGTFGIVKDKEEEKYDLILTNPPYVTKGKKTLSNEINDNAELKKIYKINSIGIEGLAVEWIIRNLKKKGSAFIILPDGLLNRLADKRMRDFILKECYLNAVISLPKKTFFATTKKTYIVSITKKDDLKDKQVFPVFTYIVKDIGERLDVTRFDIESDDLREMVSLFNQYKGSEDSFIPDKPKCKIQPIEKFYNEFSWIIDRWWSNEEKQKLGIVEAEEILSLDEFQDKIEELQDSLKEAMEELKKINQDTDLKFIELEIKDLFDLKVNTNHSSFTRAFVDSNKGKIPVYSASKDPDFIGYGKVKDNLSGIKYFENCLTWNIDGYIGKAFYRKGRFTLSEKVIPLILNDEYKETINYEYVKYVLEKEATKKEMNFSNKAGKSRISDIKIKIPIKTIDGEVIIDFDKQQELSKKYIKIEEIKQQISNELSSFRELSVEL